MSDHIFGYQQRRLTATNRWARNGNLVQAGAARSVLYTLGQVAQYRRKVVLSHCVDLDSIPTGNTGTTTRWIARFRSGLQASELHYHMVMALDSERTPSVDPYVVWALTEVGTGTTNSEALHFGYSANASNPPDDTTDEFMIGTLRQTISADTEYEIALLAVDYARPVACVVYEAAPLVIDDTASGGVDPNIAVNQDIFDSQHDDIYTQGHNLWKKNAAVLGAWTADDSSDVTSISSTSWTNVIDAGTGGPGATTAGFQIESQYHSRLTDSGVPIELSVYAERSAGTGTCKVRINDGTTQITTGAITTAGWYTVTGNLTDQAWTKWDPEGQSDGSTTLKVWAVVVAEYEA